MSPQGSLGQGVRTAGRSRAEIGASGGASLPRAEWSFLFLWRMGSLVLKEWGHVAGVMKMSPVR